MRRDIGRRSILGLPALALLRFRPARSQDYPIVQPGAVLEFPRDHGAHPDFRTEWWYVTGWLRTDDGRDLGFQVTFFRTRPEVGDVSASAFAPRQILFAHAALSDPALGHLLQAQRAARAGFGLAEATTGDADIVLDSWHFKRAATGRFETVVAAPDFTLDLAFTPTQPVLPQGEAGYSRKGPAPEQASYYYSLPHLAVTGAVVANGTRQRVTGTAWLDREWSSTLLDPHAVGWDWLGLNLDDGGALTAFQMRDAAGQALWAGGSLRRADGTVTVFGPHDVVFAVVRLWRSARTNALYPVEQSVTVTLPEGPRIWRLTPLFDDQELDGRLAGGPVYWEGAVRTEQGRGYLELTGYFEPLKM